MTNTFNVPFFAFTALIETKYAYLWMCTKTAHYTFDVQRGKQTVVAFVSKLITSEK